MSTRIFKDVEEALSRQVRRITFHEDVTQTDTVLQDVFDPFTGEVVQMPIEADFYDSSADTKAIQYPHFFIRLMKARHDRFSNRESSARDKSCLVPVRTAAKAYDIVVSARDAQIATAGNDLVTTIFNIRKVEPGHLIRITSGNNVGTYIVDSITVDEFGNHTITVTDEVASDLPDSFIQLDSGNTKVFFNGSVDLNTVKAGDTYVDASAASFAIDSVDASQGVLTLTGIVSPDITSGGKVTRTGNVFQTADAGLISYLVMDKDKPVKATFPSGEEETTTVLQGMSQEIPLDLFYMIRIDSKEQDVHIRILNRMWEEFNPPRTALPTVRRTKLSAEQALTADALTGATTIYVEDNSKFNINDPIFIFDDLVPTKGPCAEFLRPFTSTIVDLIGTDQIVIEDSLPQDFLLTTCPKIVSNAEFRLYFFHFVDHNTKDIEGSQYWVHEFSFWVQVWIDRNEEIQDIGVVTDIGGTLEDNEGNVFTEF